MREPLLLGFSLHFFSYLLKLTALQDLDGTVQFLLHFPPEVKTILIFTAVYTYPNIQSDRVFLTITILTILVN